MQVEIEIDALTIPGKERMIAQLKEMGVNPYHLNQYTCKVRLALDPIAILTGLHFMIKSQTDR